MHRRKQTSSIEKILILLKKIYWYTTYAIYEFDRIKLKLKILKNTVFGTVFEKWQFSKKSTVRYCLVWILRKFERISEVAFKDEKAELYQSIYTYRFISVGWAQSDSIIIVTHTDCLCNFCVKNSIFCKSYYWSN